MTETATQPAPPQPYKYDIVVSFAGEDRAYVADFVARCKEQGYSVFYDVDEAALMWGEELTEFFERVYLEEGRVAVMFISEHYERKAWTIHERRTILLRALEQAAAKTGPYVLPIRIDDTALPGLRASVSYMDANVRSLDEIVAAIQTKLGEPLGGTPYQFPWRTPRTREEAEYVVGERPDFWEYYYTAYLFHTEATNHDRALREVRHRYYEPGMFVPGANVLKTSTTDIASLYSLAESFVALLGPETQEEAWGKPDEPGDIEAIEHLATRLGQLLSWMIAWARRVGSYTTDSEEGRDVLKALAAFIDQPLKEVRGFVDKFRDDIDGIRSQVETKGSVSLSFPVAWVVSDAANAEYDRALEAFAAAQ